MPHEKPELARMPLVFLGPVVSMTLAAAILLNAGAVTSGTPPPPFTPHGCPFQAWSVGGVLRLTTGLRAALR